MVKNPHTHTMPRPAAHANIQFVAAPREINFYDVAEETAATLELVVTNASGSIQAFKLLEIEDKYVNYFKIDYVKPGEMAPGTACRLKITFLYQNRAERLTEHIHTQLVFRHQAGDLVVPVNCYVKMPNIFLFSGDRAGCEKLCGKLLKSAEQNNLTQEEEANMAQDMHLKTLVSGKQIQYLYLLNSGSVQCSADFALGTVNDKEVITKKAITENANKISEYDTNE